MRVIIKRPNFGMNSKKFHVITTLNKYTPQKRNISSILCLQDESHRLPFLKLSLVEWDHYTKCEKKCHVKRITDHLDYSVFKLFAVLRWKYWILNCIVSLVQIGMIGLIHLLWKIYILVKHLVNVSSCHVLRAYLNLSGAVMVNKKPFNPLRAVLAYSSFSYSMKANFL